MSRVLRSGTGVLALACGFAVLAGCSSASTSSQGQAPTASASSGLAIPGTHRETKTYQIPAPVSLTNNVGAINAAFAAPPATIQAATRVGAIKLRVPDSTAYRVSADAHIGKATVSVRESASSAHAITATTDVGAIVIAPTG
jgi:hypothetical protein